MKLSGFFKTDKSGCFKPDISVFIDKSDTPMKNTVPAHSVGAIAHKRTLDANAQKVTCCLCCYLSFSHEYGKSK